MKHSLQSSADYSYLEFALNEQRLRFTQLIEEMNCFQPASTDEVRARLLVSHGHMAKINSTENFLSFVDGQAEISADPKFQFQMKYYERYSAECISSSIVSAALCEATINAILAYGFVQQSRSELFQLVESADLKQKWLLGPKILLEKYSFDKGGKMYEALDRLVKIRNSYLHHKIWVTNSDGTVAIEGNKRLSFPMNKSEQAMILRIVDLPYELHSNFLENVDQTKFPLSFGGLLNPHLYRKG